MARFQLALIFRRLGFGPGLDAGFIDLFFFFSIAKFQSECNLTGLFGVVLPFGEARHHLMNPDVSIVF